MTNKIILLFTLLAYSLIVSQSFMYLLSLKTVQLNLSANAYVEFRKLVDTAMRSNFKYVLYAALLGNVLLVAVNFRNPGSLVFITAIIALIALVADILLTVKGNLPVNDVINSWSADNIPSNWQVFRDKWFHIFQFRQVASITGFASLLVAAIFGTK